MHPLLEEQLVKTYGSADKVPPEVSAFLGTLDAALAASAASAASAAGRTDDSRALRETNARLAEQLEVASSKAKELVDMRAALLNALEDAQSLERRLKDNLSMFNLVTASMPSGLLVEDQKRRVFVTNAEFCRMFGIAVSPAEIIGADSVKEAAQVKGLLSDPDGFLRRIEEVVKRREPAAEEILFADGRVLTREYTPISGGEGKFIGHLWQYRDITDIRRATEKLRSSASQQAASAELSRAALIENDVQALLSRAAEAVGKAFGVDFVRILEHDAEKKSFVMRAAYGWPAGSVGTAVVSSDIGTQPGYTLASGKSVIAADFGKESRFSMDPQLESAGVRCGVSTLITGEHGKPYGVLSAHSKAMRPFADDDVRFVETIANTIGTSIDRERSRRKVKELDALKNKFIQTVSHQFRTPLNAVRWNLEALLAEELGPLKPEQREFVRVTYDANREVIARIHDLLTALDIEEGRVLINKEQISIESLWGSVMADWHKRCTLKDLQCEFKPPAAPLPPVTVDADKIRTILEKLADNAVTYTPEKGRIGAALRLTDDGKVRFEIKDSGIGIPPSEQARIFERFYRATNAPTMKPDSSGLGLSISKYFADQHGGSLGFDSKEGEGTTFWLELPAK